MPEQPRHRPSAGKIAVAVVAGMALGAGLLAPGWSGSVVSFAPDRIGVAVGLAVLGLLAFTLGLWVVVAVFILR